MPWQQYAVDVALEYDPVSGELWYDEVDITVPRQSGKTTLILALLVWRCITMSRRIGEPQTCTYLAQSGKMARRKLEREFIPLLRRSRYMKEVPHSRARPVKPNEFKPSMNNGSEHILFGTGSFLQIEAPTEKGSHGDVLDLPIIDEAFAHVGDAVEQAVDAATITRKSPQMCVVSTAGNAKSFYLWGKVKAGRAACERNVETRVCYLEWSLPDDAPFDDEALWWEFLPALGHTISIERLRAKLQKALRNQDDGDDEDEEYKGLNGFRRGYLNQWAEIPPDLSERVETKMKPVDWQAVAVEREHWWKPEPSHVTLAFDTSEGWTSVGLAAGTLAESWVEVIDHRSGTMWLPGRMVELAQRWKPIAIGLDGGNVEALAALADVRQAFEDAALDPDTVKPLTSGQYKAACEALLKAVEDGKTTRPKHPDGSPDQLHSAGAVAGERVIGDAWVWDRKSSPVPLSPLVAVTCARALLGMPAPKAPPKMARLISF